MDVLFHPHCS